MEYVTELHMHSRFSRACSKDLNLKTLEKWAKVKGVSLLGTSDFTHPEWIKELKSELKEVEQGIYRSATGFPFMLTSEVSLMYSQGEKGRRVHNLIFAPNLEVVDQITEYLKSKGRIDYDGRPIFKIPCPEFTERLMEISPDIEVVPAHIWTPWFGLFGSKSGFDSLKEAFQEQMHNIHAIETGMSSNPAMNWRLSKLDNISLLSFSDSHSYWPWRMGREATVFDVKDLSYKAIIQAIRTKKGLKETIEVDPGYGKYHVDGHRACGISMEPEESRKHKNVCPKCKRPLTIGVLNRVEQLADRPLGFKPREAVPFKTLIPLTELIVAVSGGGLATQKTWTEYYNILKVGKSELDVLLNATKEQLLVVTKEKIVEAILLNREGKLQVKPGFDGVYGVPVIPGIEPRPQVGDEPKPKNKKEEKEKEQKGLGEYI